VELTETSCTFTPIPFIFISDKQVDRGDEEQKKLDDAQVHVMIHP